MAGPPSGVEPYREFVKAKREEGVELQALPGLLREKGYGGGLRELKEDGVVLATDYDGRYSQKANPHYRLAPEE